jgi:hypothetical protein
MPIEAEIHRRQLNFLHNILSCNNATIQTLVERQLVMNIDNIQSFFCQISKILDLYNLPCIQELIANPTTKLSWKIKCKKPVQNFWTYKLKELMVGKSSLRFVYNKDLKAGSIHKLWTSLYSTVSDVKKGIVKCRMLTGTYILQKDKHKFSNGKVQADCILCCIGDEDLYTC